MSKVPWHLFKERQHRAHLVVGAIVQADSPAGLSVSTAALAVLRRLARKQKPAGDYAATVVRAAGWPEVYFAFNDEADAQKFAASVQAEAIGFYSVWASQRAFEMDSAMIKEALTHDRTRSSPTPSRDHVPSSRAWTAGHVPRDRPPYRRSTIAAYY
jgi:hypothetical protein